MLKKLTNEGIQYEKLSPEEMKSKGILGRLIGVCADFRNPTRNGRKYSEKLWENVFENPIMQEKIKNGVCFGELGHPENRTQIDMEKIAVCLREQPVKNDKGQLCAVFDILDTPNGRILKTLCDYGSTVGVSSRGQGDLITDYSGDEAVDPDTYECECFDIVLIPAVETARLKYVTEDLHKDNIKMKKALIESLNNASEEDKKVMKTTLEELNINLTEEKAPLSEDEAFLAEIENNMDPEEARSYYFNHYQFDKVAPEDEFEEKVCLALKKKAGIEENLVEETEEKPTENSEEEIKVETEEETAEPAEETKSEEEIADEILDAAEVTPEENSEEVELEVTDVEEEPVKEEPVDERTDEEIFFDYLTANFDDKQIKKACKALGIELKGSDSEEKEESEPEETEEVEETEEKVEETEEVTEAFEDRPLRNELTPEDYGEEATEEVKELLAKGFDVNTEIKDGISTSTIEVLNILPDGSRVIGIINPEADSYYANRYALKLIAKALKLTEECNNESCADKHEDGSQETVNESVSAVDDGDATLIKSLQEALKTKSDLEGSVKSLQEKLAVSDTKVNELIEESNNYKKAIARLAAMSKSNKDLKESVNKLETTLNEKDAIIEEQKTRIARLVKSRKDSVSESASLTESIETKKSEITALTEDLNKSKDEVKSLNEKLSTSNTQIAELNENLNKATTLKEAYKKLANKAVNKYIDIKATTLGLSSEDIKRKLGESYSLDDVDAVCEELKEHQLNVSKLPFSTDRKVRIRVNESAPKTTKKSSEFDDDEVDEALIKIARL